MSTESKGPAGQEKRERSSRVASSRLKRRCAPESLVSLVEEERVRSANPVGQRRAIESLGFGLDMKAKGYNIFVMGPPGSGKTSVVLRLLRERAAKEERAGDLCYAFNFADPERPRPLAMPSGMGGHLQEELRVGIQSLSKLIFNTLYDEKFLKRTSRVSAQAERKAVTIFERVAEVASKYQLGLEREQEQFMVVPLLDGQPIEPDTFEEMSTEEHEDLQTRISAFQREAAPWIKAQRDHQRELQESLARLERWAIRGHVENMFGALQETFSDGGDEVRSYLKEMREYVFENYRLLLEEEEPEPENGKPQQAPQHAEVPLPFRLNLLTVSRDDGAPVVVEKEPTHPHLFGYLEYREGAAGLSTEHTLVRPGSLHRANGGYLVLQAADLIRAPEVWEDLKRAIRHKEIRIRDLSMDPEKPRIFGTIRPLAAPLNLKIILIGSAETYYLLMHEDEDFSRVFKVKSEFESWIPRDQERELKFCRFLQKLCIEEGLLPLDVSAMAQMIEESSREVEAQDKLSTSLVSSIDLLCEADYWSRQREAEKIQAEHIQKALEFRNYRHESLERTVLESIDKGETMIDTDGWVVGQINGLLVYLALDHSFGIPAKITARTYAGDKGVLNIEREAKLSGVIHSKGALTLVGLLGGLCAQQHPLTFNASITFEQNYAEIEGDSASCAEFYALLSSLAQLPIYQGIAVTGSINQQGLVQPIGAVNSKIEGMFKICKKRGLTGKQGVIIPHQNVDHLMLKDEVIEAVEAREFHIWQIKHVLEGIEILMALQAGEQEESGQWTQDSLFDRVQKRLDHFYQISKTP